MPTSWIAVIAAEAKLLRRLDAHEARAVPAEPGELGRFLVADGGHFGCGAEVLHRFAPSLGLADELVQALAELLHLKVLERSSATLSLSASTRFRTSPTGRGFPAALKMTHWQAFLC